MSTVTRFFPAGEAFSPALPVDIRLVGRSVPSLRVLSASPLSVAA
jgi:hypothetical protein